MADPRYILQFKAATGFSVVLEYGSEEKLQADEKRIREAGLEVERIHDYHFNFSNADLFMDMRSPECVEQFDLDDWI
ncbi:MAG: hypothetical protein KC553_00210 [Nitrospina sp.]|nr:hypothetical protein [Nitrospina sp.]